MKVDVMEIPSNPPHNMLEEITFIRQDDVMALTIEVIGFGCGEGKFRLIPTDIYDDEKFNPNTVIAETLHLTPDVEGYMPIPSVLVFVEPITFAYVIKDILFNS